MAVGLRFSPWPQRKLGFSVERAANSRVQSCGQPPPAARCASGLAIPAGQEWRCSYPASLAPLVPSLVPHTRALVPRARSSAKHNQSMDPQFKEWQDLTI